MNKKLIPDKFPLPRIEDILDRLGKAKCFSVMDLNSGLHQIPLEENSRAATAFSTENQPPDKTETKTERHGPQWNFCISFINNDHSKNRK